MCFYFFFYGENSQFASTDPLPSQTFIHYLFIYFSALSLPTFILFLDFFMLCYPLELHLCCTRAPCVLEWACWCPRSILTIGIFFCYLWAITQLLPKFLEDCGLTLMHRLAVQLSCLARRDWLGIDAHEVFSERSAQSIFWQLFYLIRASFCKLLPLKHFISQILVFVCCRCWDDVNSDSYFSLERLLQFSTSWNARFCCLKHSPFPLSSSWLTVMLARIRHSRD